MIKVIEYIEQSGSIFKVWQSRSMDGAAEYLYKEYLRDTKEVLFEKHFNNIQALTSHRQKNAITPNLGKTINVLSRLGKEEEEKENDR